MLQLSQLSAQQLQRAVTIKRQIESLQAQLDSIDGMDDLSVTPKRGRPKRVVPDGKIEALKRARAVRWANYKAGKLSDAIAAPNPHATAMTKRKKKRSMSPEQKATLAAMAKARWAKIKAEGKTKL